MKYRQRLVSSCAPASLQEWLAEELERRGIDGVYTRYILSLLLADTIDPAECAHVLTHSRTNAQAHHVTENKHGDKARHRRLKSWDRRKELQGLLVHHCQHVVGQCCDCSQSYLDSEQCKKLAAVECLKSASEQKSGIEKLIDEVCAKLKNFQADIETNPDSKLHADIKDGSKHSAPEEQAELYYTTFPALSGKPNLLDDGEQQTQAQDQEAWSLKTTAWGKENYSCIDKPSPVNNVEEEIEDVQNDLGKENVTERKKDLYYSEVSANAQRKEIELARNVELEREPLFIVPKMKVPPTKVRNVTMYAPFTSAASYQLQSVKQKEEKDKQCSCDENESKEEEDNVEGKMRGDVLIADAKLLVPNVAGDENDLVTDLVSKFNSELAAIWETDRHIQETSLSNDNLGISVRIISVRSPVQADVPTSINFIIGSNLPSVWSAKTEDIKILNAHDAFEPSEPVSSESSVPDLVHNEVESTKGDPSRLWSSEEEPSLLLDDKSLLKSCKLDFSDQAWEDLNQACKVGSEKRKSLYLCPDDLFPDLEEHEMPLSCSSNSPSVLDSSSEMVTGIYSLWKTPSPPPPFPMKETMQMALVTAQCCDKVANWISQQADVEESWHDLSIWRENKTLTYHKGESRFKEVVPLTRAKAEIAFQGFTENKMSLHLEECSDGLLGKPEEPEENLLTSPKTHFQPIRQDSSETESLGDLFDIVERQLVLSPHHCDHESLSVVVTPPPALIEEEEDKETKKDRNLARSISSSLDEMLILTGEFDSAEESMVENDDNIDLFESFQCKTGPELLFLEDKSTSTDNSRLAAKSTKDELNVLGFGPFHNDQIWSTDAIGDQCSNVAIPWKWSTRDDSEDTWKTGSFESSVEEDFLEKFQLDRTLNAMRKELEEEEKELFRDINLMSDSEETAFHNDFSLLSIGENWARADDNEFVDTGSPAEAQTFARQWELESDFTGVSNFLDDSKNEEPESVELPAIPAEKALYSSELESEWYKSSLSFNLQLPRKGKVKSKTHSQKQQQQHQQQQNQQRKPCSFFLEGNCRRSDCKFSHNLGSITCRFWEEGSCFKGDTCPFLHGYSSDPEFGEHPSGKCKFALESETDFPSLSTLSSSEQSCKPFPKELVVGRILRPKKKKMGPAPASTIKKANSPSPPK